VLPAFPKQYYTERTRRVSAVFGEYNRWSGWGPDEARALFLRSLRAVVIYARAERPQVAVEGASKGGQNLQITINTITRP